MIILYDIIYIIFFLCYLPVFLIRRKYHPGFLMRLGRFPENAIERIRGRKVVWLHTVSVGEAQAANLLVKNLKQANPGVCLVISTVTKTGNKIARGLAAADDLVIYSPLDISFITKQVIRLINPRLFIILETEIWPNLITNLAKAGVPVVLLNGRISSGSWRGYKLIRGFLKQVLQSFTLFCMQTKQDAQKIITLGAAKDKVKVTGNMKFDLQSAEVRLQKSDLGLSEPEKLFIAGSTHRGEEKIVLQAYKELVNNHPDLRLLIAPRHIERTGEIEKLISRFNLKSQRVSQLSSDNRLSTIDYRPILILDSIGQLRQLYALSEMVFIGGSLIPHGGQNPLEAAIFSKPILFGPYMSNFFNMADLFLKRDAAIRVKNLEQLKNACMRLLNEPGLGRELGQRAWELVRENKGASLRNLELVSQLL